MYFSESEKIEEKIGQGLKKLSEGSTVARPYIVAVDGECGSGKTTLAAELSAHYSAKGLITSVIHMDDFFVPPALRDESHSLVRIHYERFLEEVLPCLTGRVPFSYRLFSCAKQDYDGQATVPVSDIIIVEGSYSLAPVLGDYYDLSVYCRADMDLRLKRLSERCGSNRERYQKFIDLWIPSEAAYAEKYDIIKRADIIQCQP